LESEATNIAGGDVVNNDTITATNVGDTSGNDASYSANAMFGNTVTTTASSSVGTSSSSVSLASPRRDSPPGLSRSTTNVPPSPTTSSSSAASSSMLSVPPSSVQMRTSHSFDNASQQSSSHARTSSQDTSSSPMKPIHDRLLRRASTAGYRTMPPSLFANNLPPFALSTLTAITPTLPIQPTMSINIADNQQLSSPNISPNLVSQRSISPALTATTMSLPPSLQHQRSSLPSIPIHPPPPSSTSSDSLAQAIPRSLAMNPPGSLDRATRNKGPPTTDRAPLSSATAAAGGGGSTSPLLSFQSLPANFGRQQSVKFGTKASLTVVLLKVINFDPFTLYLNNLLMLDMISSDMVMMIGHQLIANGSKW
jgi:hypothetical protein